MNISDKWLRAYIETSLSAEEIGEILTDIGLEVEGISDYESIKGSLKGVVVGKVLSCQKHPNADKLKLTKIDIGRDFPISVVCGAPNVSEGQTVAVATLGTVIHPNAGEPFTISSSKIRGELSEGMLCAEDELNLGDGHDGIMILPDEYLVGKPLSEYINVEQDKVYEIGLTPNRTDAMSHYGVARDLSAYLSFNKIKSKFNELSINSIDSEGKHDFKLIVEDENLCPRYLGAIIEGVNIAESPDWLKNKLKSIGVGTINNIVDITNYILHSYGQPLHAFDSEKISGKQVKVGLVPSKTKFKALNGLEYVLDGSELIIKDSNDLPMCIAGVFGGLNSGVSKNTSSVFLESAYFNPIAVRKAAKLHGLSTDASFRFERGIDPNLTKKALLKAIEMVQDLSGGKLKGEILEFYPKKIENFKILVRYSKVRSVLGVKIDNSSIKEILNSLEIKIINETPESIEVLVPPYRADVRREIDVIEEILRIYGYNRVESGSKIEFTPANVEDKDSLEDSWARILQAGGFQEVMNNSLISSKNKNSQTVSLLNPLSRELCSLRQSLMEGLLQNADYNIKRKNSDIKFFEFGKIYFKDSKYYERKQLALLVSGNDKPENWLISKSPTNFFLIKGYVEQLLSKLKISTKEKPLIEDKRFSDGLEIIYEDKTLARIGIPNTKNLKDADIENIVFYAEIELENCSKLKNNDTFKFSDIPKFNKIRRDLALLLDKSVVYNDIFNASKNISPYLKKIQLFDVYEGKNLPENKKSYALSFELLNEERTLEDSEITNIINKLIKMYQEKFGAELR